MGVGVAVPRTIGIDVGDTLDTTPALPVGCAVTVALGAKLGAVVGLALGVSECLADGATDGNAVGAAVGVADGVGRGLAVGFEAKTAVVLVVGRKEVGLAVDLDVGGTEGCAAVSAEHEARSIGVKPAPTRTNAVIFSKAAAKSARNSALPARRSE